MADRMVRTAVGIANLHRFRRGQFIVAVEGGDDKVFWKVVFPEGRGVHLEAAGGQAEALKVFEKVRKKGVAARTLVAIDSGYDDLLHDKPAHRLLLKTGRHSIENYLCEPIVLDEVTCLCSRVVNMRVGARWLEAVSRSCRDLLLADLAAARDKRPSVWPREWRKLVSKSCVLKREEVRDHLRRCGAAEGGKEEGERILRGRPAWHYLPGHVLMCLAREMVLGKVTRLRQGRYRVSREEFFKDCVNKFTVCRTRIPGARRLRRKAAEALRALASAGEALP